MSEDEQEAKSIAYNIARIVRLSSGQFALFAPWSNTDGLPIIHIGELSTMADIIPTAEDCAAWIDSITPIHEAHESKINLAAALGIKKPQLIIERRL